MMSSQTEEANQESNKKEELLWPRLVEQTSNIIRDNFFINDVYNRGEVQNKCAAKFFQQCPLNFMRNATMELITKTHKLITAAIKDGDSKNTIHKILVEFDEWLSDKDAEFIGQISSATVTQNTWEKCFKIIVYQSPLKKITALDTLFSIRSPQTVKQKTLIEANIRKLLDQKATFKNGMDWIKIFALKDFKAAEFNNIVYRALIFGHERLLKESLKTFNEKLKCIRLLDGCYYRADRGKLEIQLEKDFVNFITIQKIPALIQRVSNSYGISVDKYRLYASRALFKDKTTVIYKAYDRCYFELYALEALKSCTHQNKMDFLNVIYEDRKYAYCWAKYLQLKKRELPVFLNGCEHFEPDAVEFAEKISNVVLDPVDEDCIVNRKFWGKTYKFITIVTPEALDNFMEECFIQSKPKILGMDCEAAIGKQGGIQKITVLQLATPEWLCLIDVQLLLDKLSAAEWKKIFENIFDPDIIRIGFSFSSDFAYICNEFPFLQRFFQEKERKVLCLQKFTTLITNLDGIFKTHIPANCGLAVLAKEILDIEMDKSLQNSNWTKRPLTHFQKLYAVSDALVGVLIFEKLEKLLNEKLDDASDIWNKAYVSHIA